MRPSMDHLSAAFEARSTAERPQWLQTLQSDAWNRALAHGLPWRKDEHWKYTSLFGVAKLPLTASGDDAAESAPVVDAVYTENQATRLDWINGRAVIDCALPEGVTFSVLDDEATFLSSAPTRTSVMQDLNHAFADTVGVLRIGANTRLDKPLYLVHHLTGTHVLASQRLHIVIADNCEVDLVDHLVGDSTDSVNNRRWSVEVGANSQVRHTRIQQEATSATVLDNIDVSVGRDAHYASAVFDLGAALARHDLGVALNAANAQCSMLAVYLPHQDQHVDHHTLVRHNQPNTHSEQRYNGVAGSKGHGVFNGKVFVQQDAQKITAAQSNQNILLCEQAAIDTKPELEIYADDVKCSHGATVGQLDETSLFYLQSRGLAKREAQQLLVRGFVRDIYANVRCETLHAWLDQAISRKLDSLVEHLS